MKIHLNIKQEIAIAEKHLEENNQLIVGYIKIVLKYLRCII